MRSDRVVWIALPALAWFGACSDEAPARAARPSSPVPFSGGFTTSTTALGARPVGVALGRCDDDDALDLVVFGAEPAGIEPNTGPGPRPEVFLGGRDGTFREHGGAGLPGDSVGAAVFADLDGDAREDLVLVDARVRVARNLGECRFEAAREVSPDAPTWGRSVVVTDVDLDGVADLSVSYRGRTADPFRVLLGRGDGSYEPVAMTLPETNSGSRELLPFAAYWDDFDGDGARDLFALIDTGESWFAWGLDRGAYAHDPAYSAQASSSDPMSIAPIDRDDDGVIDYFVSGLDGRSLLLRGGTRRFLDDAFDAGVEGGHPSFAWSAWAFDADLDGRRDLLVERLGSEEDGAQAAPMQLYLARGDGTFSEQGAAARLGSFRSKSMACGDLTGGGASGCVVMTPTGLVLLRNELAPRGRWAHLRLRGRVSEPNAEGARVVVPAMGPGAIYYGAQVAYAVSHDRGLLVGIGDRESTEIEVRWPSGLRQRAQVTAGRVTEVVEPEVVTLSARTARADGRSEVVVTLSPQAAGAAAASVALDGPGTLRQVSPSRWTLTAPAAAGNSRLTVLLDGRALLVRPVVRWVAR